MQLGDEGERQRKKTAAVCVDRLLHKDVTNIYIDPFITGTCTNATC